MRVDRFIWQDGDFEWLDEKQEGGAGSGNFGHAGIPGHLGGSTPGGGAAPYVVTEKDVERASNDLYDMAREWHNNSSRKNYRELVYHVKHGGPEYEAAARQSLDRLAFAADGKITLYRGGEVRPLAVQSWTTDKKWAERFSVYGFGSKGRKSPGAGVITEKSFSKGDLLYALPWEGEVLVGRKPKAKKESEKQEGGPGSGNFGHAGRPGEVGGSSGKHRSSGGAKPGYRTPEVWGTGTWAYKGSKNFCETDAKRLEEGVPKELLSKRIKELLGDDPMANTLIKLPSLPPKPVSPPEGAIVHNYGPRTGLCYEMAARFVMDNPDWKVVHATLFPRVGDFANSVYLHGFAEKGSVVFDGVHGRFFDREAYYKYYDIMDVRTFDHTTMNKKLLQIRQWGAWDE